MQECGERGDTHAIILRQNTLGASRATKCEIQTPSFLPSSSSTSSTSFSLSIHTIRTNDTSRLHLDPEACYLRQIRGSCKIQHMNIVKYIVSAEPSEHE